MPIESTHPPITIPPVDLYTFLFDRPDSDFPEDHGKFHDTPQASLHLLTRRRQAIFVDVAAQTRLSVRDVRTAALQFGQALRQNWNLQKGEVLALFTPNSTEVAAVTFGTLWAGGVVCPVNNLYTVGELVSQLKSSHAKALVTHVACLEIATEAASLAGLPLDRVVLVGPRDPKGRVRPFSDLRSSNKDVQKVEINPKEDLAYLVYSSGTTGLPKGVMLTHENMVANILQGNVMDGDKMKSGRDRTIGFLPMYHIYGELSPQPEGIYHILKLRHPGIAVLILQPLHRGVTVYVMQRFELEPFCRIVQDEKITFAFVVPPVVLALAKHPIVAKYNLSSLRMMHSSAAPLTNDLVQMVYQRLKVPIKQGYGLSEAAPGVASQVCHLSSLTSPVYFFFPLCN